MSTTQQSLEREPDAEGLAELGAAAKRIQSAVEQVIEGKPDVTRLALVVLLGEGHLLIEDVPGVGKTMLSKALAKAIDCSVITPVTSSRLPSSSPATRPSNPQWPIPSPPSTGMTAPVTYPAASLASQVTTAATSSGAANRPAGMPAR